MYRPLAFVKYLETFGWEPTVIAPRGDSFWIRDEGLCEQIPESVRVIRTDTLSGQSLLARARRGGGGASQRRSSRLFAAARRVSAAMVLPDTYRGWQPYALAAVRGVLGEETFDVLYSTSPPETSHLVAARVHEEHGLPWVADFRDPWMNLHLLRPPTPLHARLHRSMEARVCRTAHVVVTTRWHETFVHERYPGAPSVTRIANGYDAEDAESVAGVAPERSPMRITHAGMLTQKRSAVPFLRGLRAFLDAHPEARQDVEVRFLGAREDANERAVGALGLGDVVRFADTVPHRETLQIEKSSHILLLIKHVNRDYQGLVPGKLYEYIGLCRPILALAPPGEARDIVEGLRRGEVVEQKDEGEVARAIGRLYEAYRDGALESRYDLSPRPELTRERLAGELAALFERVASGGKKSN